MCFSNSLDQSDKNRFSWHNDILIDSNQSSEVIDEQYYPTFFSSFNQKEYNVLENVIVPFDNANLSFLNENKTVILKEEICSLNQDLLTILEDKETKFEIYIGKTSPTLIKHDQDILLRGSIPESHFPDGPFVSFKPLPICNEQDNLSSSYFLVKDIDLILGEEVNEHLKSNANTQIEENFSFKEISLSTNNFTFLS